MAAFMTSDPLAGGHTCRGQPVVHYTAGVGWESCATLASRANPGVELMAVMTRITLEEFLRAEETKPAGDVLDGGGVLPGFSVPVDDIFAQLQA